MDLHEPIDDVNETLKIGAGVRAKLENFADVFQLFDRPDPAFVNDAAHRVNLDQVSEEWVRHGELPVVARVFTLSERCEILRKAASQNLHSAIDLPSAGDADRPHGSRVFAGNVDIMESNFTLHRYNRPMATALAPFPLLLVPYDGSDPARAALTLALAIATGGASIALINIVAETVVCNSAIPVLVVPAPA